MNDVSKRELHVKCIIKNATSEDVDVLSDHWFVCMTGCIVTRSPSSSIMVFVPCAYRSH